MINHLSSDPTVNGLFMQPDVEVHEDEVLSPDEEAEVSRMENEAEERAQAESDEWYRQREGQSTFEPEALLDALSEDWHTILDDDPNPYAGTYSEE